LSPSCQQQPAAGSSSSLRIVFSVTTWEVCAIGSQRRRRFRNTYTEAVALDSFLFARTGMGGPSSTAAVSDSQRMERMAGRRSQQDSQHCPLPGQLTAGGQGVPTATRPSAIPSGVHAPFFKLLVLCCRGRFDCTQTASTSPLIYC
jgi:hypothetical protein